MYHRGSFLLLQMSKPFWQSRTLWANLIAAVAFFVQQQYGYVIDPAIQGYILVGVNAFLRLITSEELTA